MSERKKPYTTAEVFDIICSRIEMPEGLEYASATRYPEEIRTEDFRIVNNLDYGSNEGIFLDLGIRFYDDGKNTRLGCFKTLDRSPEAMHRMASLLADFVVEFNKFCWEEIDNLCWEGWEVYTVGPDGESNGGYCCRGAVGRAKRRLKELLEDHETVYVRDNATREVKTFRASEYDEEVAL